MRVEASYMRDGTQPRFVGAEYPLDTFYQQNLLREAAATGRIVTGPGFAATGDVSDSARPDFERMHRVAVVPLAMGEHTVALMILSREEPRDFNQRELQSLQQYGIVAAQALRNYRLLQQIRSAQGRGLDALTRISEHLAGSDDQTSFFTRMSDTVADLAGARRASFWLLEGEALCAQPSAGFTAEQLEQMRIDLDNPEAGNLRRVVENREAVAFTLNDYPEGGSWHRLLGVMGVSNGMAVPWRTAGQTIGALIAYDRDQGWGPQEEWMLRLCARASALVRQGYEAERRAAELTAAEVQRLAEHASRIAMLDEQKSEFLRLASHELRTPMTLVRGYLSMLEEGALGALPPAAAKVLPVMSVRMNQMTDLVEQMLAASRAQDLSLLPVPAPLALLELTSQTADSIQGLLHPGQRIHVEGDASVRALADVEQTRTILGNLISNAVKYSPEGDDVAVRVGSGPGAATVMVADRGIGIRQEDAERLFRPFGRADSDQVRAIVGTGLGLYLSRRLARLQGGDVDFTSELGRGSTFTLTLPAAPPA